MEEISINSHILGQVFNPPQTMEDELQYVDNGDKARKALIARYPKDRVIDALARNRKTSWDNAEDLLIENMADKARKMRSEEYKFSEEDIQTAITGSIDDPNLASTIYKRSHLPRTYSKQSLPFPEQVRQAQELSASVNNIYNSYGNNFRYGVLGIFSQDETNKALEQYQQLNTDIVNRLTEEGFKASVNDDGQIYVHSIDGVPYEVTPTFWQSLTASRAEASLSASGSLLGTAAGVMMAPQSLGLSMFIGGLAGGAIGGSSGRSIDLFRNASIAKDKLEISFMAKEMFEAGVFDATASIVGEAGLSLTASSVRGLNTAWKFVKGGRPQSAAEFLKSELGYSDDMVKSIVDNYVSTLDKAPERTIKGMFGTKKVVPLNKDELSVAAILETDPRALEVVNGVVSQSLKTTRSILDRVDGRAKEVKKLAEQIYDPDTAYNVRKAYKEYESDVVKSFGEMRGIAEDIIDNTDYSFDAKKLGLEPVLKVLQEGAGDTAKKDSAINMVAKIEKKTSGREFSDLFELRASVNKKRYAGNLEFTDKEALDKAIVTIDKEISKAAKLYMGKEAGKEWLDLFSRSKKTYSDMMRAKENQLFKSVVEGRMTEGGMQDVISKWSLDTTNDIEVMNVVKSRLSPAMASKMEVAAVKSLIDKHTLGAADSSLQAIDFPVLQQQLGDLKIDGPEGKYLKEVVDFFANTFKNDASLGRISGSLRKPSEIASLSTDPVTIGKMAIARNILTSITQFLPTDAGRRRALFETTKNIFDNPLNYKNQQKLLAKIPEMRRDDTAKLITDLGIAVMKSKQRQSKESFVRVYQKSKDGKDKLTTGNFGEGFYYSKKVVKDNPNQRVIGKEINVDQFATLDDVRRVLSHPNITNLASIMRLKGARTRLREAGFMGLKDEQRFMVFKD